MSGGPLINKETNELIGLLSPGWPVDPSIKTQTFAVSIGGNNVKRIVDSRLLEEAKALLKSAGVIFWK